MHRYPPFYDENPFLIYEKILKTKVQFPQGFNPDAKDLIKKLLHSDSTMRLGNTSQGVNDIMDHRYVPSRDRGTLNPKP